MSRSVKKWIQGLPGPFFAATEDECVVLAHDTMVRQIGCDPVPLDLFKLTLYMAGYRVEQRGPEYVLPLPGGPKTRW